MDPNESGNLIKNFVVQNAPGANETATVAQVIQAILTQFGLSPAQLIAALSKVEDFADSGLDLTAADNGKIYRCTAAVDIVVTTPEEDPGVPFSVAFIQGHVGGAVVFNAAAGTTLQSYNDLNATAGIHAWASLIRVAANTYNLSGTLA